MDTQWLLNEGPEPIRSSRTGRRFTRPRDQKEREMSNFGTKRLPIACVLMGLLGTGCAPFLVFPGGELRGELESSVIDDWGFTDEVEFVQIQTRPGRPYSVQVYGVGSGSAFYIASQGWRGAMGSTSRARWINHLVADRRIRLLVDETLYELDGVRVRDDLEVARVRQLFLKKYGDAAESWGFWRKNPETPKASEAFVFRLDPR